MKDSGLPPISSATATKLFGKGRYKLYALLAILLLACWSMLTGTVTLKSSASADADARSDLDILEVEEREKVVRKMWGVYSHNRQIRLPRFWREAFEAAYEDLASDASEVREHAISEIARMSMRRIVDLETHTSDPKKTKGRQKLEMKKIDNIDALQVSFSKRRSGMFKKASELSTLCGAEIAIVVNSPAGRAFTFGKPSVDAIADRFLGSDLRLGPRATPNQIPKPEELYREVTVHHMNKRCMELSDQLEEQKKKREALEERLRTLAHGPRGALTRGRDGIQSLGLEDLQKIAKEMEDLRAKVDARCREALNGLTGSSGRALDVNPIQMVNPEGNETMNASSHWFMGGGDPSIN